MLKIEENPQDVKLSFVPDSKFQIPHELAKIKIQEKLKIKPSKKNSLLPLKEGRWQPDQDEVYMQFIRENEELFVDEHTRRSKKVFDRLAKLLNNNRTAEQCRSHHQKMQRKTKNGSMDAICEYLIKKNERKRAKEQKKKLQENEDQKTEGINVEHISDPKKQYKLKIIPRKTFVEFVVDLVPNFSFPAW